jgi:hypothetical protein
MADKMSILENIHRPGKTYQRNAAKVAAVERSMLMVLPMGPPGLGWAQLKPLVCDHLPEELFPGGAKVGWWMKSVQLDLEAKGKIARSATSPLHFWRT